MPLRHAHTLAQARTSVAALADQASHDDASSAYEHVLIELDRLHDDQSPDVNLDALTRDRAIQRDLATVATEDLKQHGVDPLRVELILWMLRDADTLDCG